MAGLESMHAAGALHAFEASKQDYIGRHGDDPLLLVQGPPGTGKSYATAFAAPKTPKKDQAKQTSALPSVGYR